MGSEEPGRASGREGTLILGIDPGTATTGWGLVLKVGNRVRHVDCGVWRTRSADGAGRRLRQLADALSALVRERRPDAVAIEQAFVGKNIQSALRLGEARGALLACCDGHDLPIFEYPTASVKKAVVGNGRADKTQVQFMLQRLLALEAPPSPHDAADGLALAFTLALDWGLQRGPRPGLRVTSRERG